MPWRWLLAGGVGLALTLFFNWLGFCWLGATVFGTDALYDGSAAIVTLALPALLGGIGLGLTAREAGLNVAAATFALFCAAGFLHPFWRIPAVSPASAHSGAMHYFLQSPLVVLAFGTLGAWAASQFATGRWTLADEQPISPT